MQDDHCELWNRRHLALKSSPAACTAGTGRFLRRKIPFSRAKIASLQFPRPEIHRILAETGRGAHEGRRLWRKQAVVSPMSKEGPLVRFAHDAERPLRIEDGSGGGAHEARAQWAKQREVSPTRAKEAAQPVAAIAADEPSEAGSAASELANDAERPC